MVNITRGEELNFPDDLTIKSPEPSEYYIYEPTSSVQKQAYKIVANGMRGMRTYTQDATAHLRQLSYTDLSLETLLIIMIVSVVITLASFLMIFHQFIQIEHLQRDIISLYAYMKIESIEEILWKTNTFMVEIADGSFMRKITVLKDEGKRQRSTKGSQTLKNISQQEDGGHF